MRLLDTYALHCGAKIDKPYIYESYFPLPFQKYITFQAETPYESRNYSYWQDVIDMIVPILSNHGIVVLQTGLSKESGFQRLVDIRGQTSIHQLAYLIGRSMLHFGPDSFGVHLASHFDIPIVSLYSISMPEVAGPHFGDKSKHTLFKGYERVGNKKPSYSQKEQPKSIDTIKPEEIANAIFKHLNLEERIPFQTIMSGEGYSHRMRREIIPDSHNVMQFPEQPIEIRADLFFDEALLAHHLNYWKKGILITDKALPLPLLKQFKPHITLISYEITENDDPVFVKALAELGIPIVLVSKLSEEQLQAKKIKYYEFGTINRIPPPNQAKLDLLKPMVGLLYYRSCKLVASKGKIYASHADREADVPLNSDVEYHKVIDSQAFWQDLEFCTFIKKI